MALPPKRTNGSVVALAPRILRRGLDMLLTVDQGATKPWRSARTSTSSARSPLLRERTKDYYRFDPFLHLRTTVTRPGTSRYGPSAVAREVVAVERTTNSASARWSGLRRR